MSSSEQKIDASIIKEIKILHSLHDHSREIFQYKHLKAYDAKVISRLERQKISWTDALAASGIDPKCHFGKFNYGKTVDERKLTFGKIIRKIALDYGESSLNDNSMNTDEEVDLPDNCWSEAFQGNFPECVSVGCKPKKLSRKSVYQNGRRLFGNWNTALQASGIDAKKVLRKPAAHELSEIVKALHEYDLKSNSIWTITKMRVENNSLERAIYNLKNRAQIEIPFQAISDDIVYVMWVNMMYWREHQRLSEDLTWYTSLSANLEETYRINHRGQEQWDENSIILGIQGIFGKGENVLRLSRDDVEKRGAVADKTLWSALRQERFRNAGINEEKWFKNAGILISRLREKYKQIDERYNAKECLDFFAMRMRESLELGENRLTREFNAKTESDFVNFIIGKFGSWDAGLKEHGLDPKFFSITASKRAKRGYQFQKFIEEQFILSGLTCVSRDPKKGEFVSNRSIRCCSHEVKCKPDFRFENLIIDTKTGYHASQKPEQLIRYYDHVPNVIILTLNDADRIENIDGRPIRVIGFNDFVGKSEELIGCALSNELKAELSAVLRQHPFWI